MFEQHKKGKEAAKTPETSLTEEAHTLLVARLDQEGQRYRLSGRQARRLTVEQMKEIVGEDLIKQLMKKTNHDSVDRGDGGQESR